MGLQTCQLVTKKLYRQTNKKWYQINIPFEQFEAYKRSWHEIHKDHTLSSKDD